MGRAYALVTGLCYSGDGFEERGQRLFAEVLERLHDVICWIGRGPGELVRI